MIARVSLLAIFSLSLVALPARAATCPTPVMPIRVHIKSNPGKVIFKTGYGREGLKRLQRRNSRQRIASAANPLGLTLTDFRFSIKTTVRVAALGGGRHCATPDSFRVDIGFSDFLVYIDRRYKRRSCEYRAILEHENTHVSLYRAYLARHVPELRRRAEAVALRIKPVYVRVPDAGAKNIQNQMQVQIKPIIDRINTEADAANARIDTPRSYRDVQLLCDNW